MRSKLVYICSPYRGNVEENTKNARAYSLKAMTEHPDVIPIAPHLLFTQFLDDNDPEQRRIGLDAGLDLLSICDELWVYGEPSEGMAAEIRLAEELCIPIRDGFSPDDYDPDTDEYAYGCVNITTPGAGVYAEDSGIFSYTASSIVKIEAQTVFDMARWLRLNPGKEIDYVVKHEEDPEVRP